MESWFGVNRLWYGGTVTNKKEVVFALERTKTDATFKNKSKKHTKKVLDLSKLTLFGIRDRT